MGLVPLDNAAWGFTSSCFVCQPDNQRGLRIAFAHDDGTDEVVAEFNLGPELSGAPRYVHGGVVLAVLDEAMAWAAIACAGRFCVVQHTATTFERPVRVGETHRVRASARIVDERTVTARAEVSRVEPEGSPIVQCAQAHARLVVLSSSSAARAIGIVEGDDAAYLRSQTGKGPT